MQPSRPTVYLFDIDGTLLLTGGAGRRSFQRAFQQVTGRDDALSQFTFEGMTDRAIARRGLLAIDREPSEELIEALVASYLQALADELPRTQKYTVMPYVREVVAQLGALAHAAVGLGTGNVKRGAQAKLAHGQLWQHFQFGGFGCDHELRSELLRRGKERGAQQLGHRPEECRVVVIGDTVRDVEAAHAIGAQCLAVCTGGGSADVLRAAGAHMVVRDLAENGALTWLLNEP